jgi:hypothetical protein
VTTAVVILDLKGDRQSHGGFHAPEWTIAELLKPYGEIVVVSWQVVVLVETGSEAGFRTVCEAIDLVLKDQVRSGAYRIDMPLIQKRPQEIGRLP